MKIYYYKYTFRYPNLKEEEIEFFTTKVEELIKKVKENKDKWYISNEEVYVLDNAKNIKIEKIINPF